MLAPRLQLSRHHDAYLQPIQGALYKASPPFGAFGSRRLALDELTKQLAVLEGLAARGQRASAGVVSGPYLAGGASPTLADCTLFPTLVFCAFMLPRFDLDAAWDEAPSLRAYWQRMTEVDPVGQVRAKVPKAAAAASVFSKGRAVTPS